MTRRMGREGVSVIMAAFLITVVAAMGTAVAYMTRDAQTGSVDFFKSVSSFYAAQSGLEWARQSASGYTTADRDRWLELNGAAMEFGSDGARFVIGIDYIDADNDPSTDDMVTITSTGTAGGGERTVRMSVTVPAGNAGGELFSDHFDQPDSLFFDSRYTFGATDAPHSGMTPYITAGNIEGGDTRDVFTLSSEAGGAASVIVMGGQEEARLYLSADSCVKWNTAQTQPNATAADCVNTPGQQARTGMNVPIDDMGYQNYFIKVRARLLSGVGFGVYFRAGYPNENDPAAIGFGGLTGYIWQYDAGMGYFSPCDMLTAIAGSDGEGMLFTRRVSQGSETCGAECEIFSGANAGASGSSAYPFFCPENRTGLAFLNGWRWTNTNWAGRWRTIYIYVYRDRVNVYVGREEIIGHGGENDPEHVGMVYLSSVPGELITGGVGIRTIAGSLAAIDYIKVYDNSNDSNPSTLPGGS